MSNNQNANLNDKLYKVRPVLNGIVRNWKKYYVLHQKLCIDERMIKFRGRSDFLQYVPTKPMKWGFKAFILADAITAYTYNLIVYTGSQGTRTRNLANNVILELAEGLTDLGHQIFFDSYYCSVPIVEYLSTRGTGCTGVIRKNRKFIPDAIKNPPASLQAGETLLKKKASLMCFIYKGKKDVRFLTNVWQKTWNRK